VSGVGGEVLKSPDEVVVDVAGMADLVLRSPVGIESSAGSVRDILSELRKCHHFTCGYSNASVNTHGDSDVIVMQDGFRRHLVGKTFEKCMRSATAISLKYASLAS